jgi:PAS domain S-box-containing protein
VKFKEPKGIEKGEAEARLREENERLKAFLAHVGGALAVLGPDCHVIWTSEESLRYFGLKENAIGRRCYDVIPTTEELCKVCVARRAFATGQVQTRVAEHRTAAGELRYYHGIGTPIRNRSGRVTQVMVLAQDVTELCRVQQELQKKTEMLEIQNRRVLEAAKEKSRFFAGMSHELRTPMTAIIGFTEMLLEDADEPLAPNQRSLLLKVSENAERLVGMINEILDLSKIEAGKMRVDLSRVDLDRLISHVIETMMPLVKSKDLTLSWQAAEELPIIRTDEQKLRQILVNLVSNAIKFTPKGSVTVRAALRSSRISIAVSDTGIGIRQSDLGKIFQEFSQVGGRGAGGTGLGLAITQRLVNILGGEIRVSSKLGEGSTFTVTLPAAQE